MRNRIQAVLVLAILLTLAGMILPAVCAVRDAAARIGCTNNLRQFGLALQNYQGCNGTYPHGTVAGSDLPAERRLSVYADFHSYMEAGCKFLFDVQKPWDDEVNAPVKADCKAESTADRIIYQKRVIGKMAIILCERNLQGPESGPVSRTQYVGVAGVGVDAATWPREHAKAGLFGYDRAARPEDIKDGQATTLAFIETSRDNGPWTAGGPATVRGLDPNGPPYFGPDSQFTAFHRGINAAFLDGSVRTLSARVDPRILEALATIAGGEEIQASDY